MAITALEEIINAFAPLAAKELLPKLMGKKLDQEQRELAMMAMIYEQNYRSQEIQNKLTKLENHNGEMDKDLNFIKDCVDSNAVALSKATEALTTILNRTEPKRKK